MKGFACRQLDCSFRGPHLLLLLGVFLALPDSDAAPQAAVEAAEGPKFSDARDACDPFRANWDTKDIN